MSNWILIRRIRGPVYILTVGVLAMFNEWTRYGFHRTWPVFIIVAGVLMFAERSAYSQAVANGEIPVVATPPPYAVPPVYPAGPGTEIVPHPPDYPPVEPR
jgi:uncharacterized membrane protein